MWLMLLRTLTDMQKAFTGRRAIALQAKLSTSLGKLARILVSVRLIRFYTLVRECFEALGS